jgi:translation initiation factor 1
VHPFRDIRFFSEIDSTNRWLREASASGEARHGTVAIADEQVAGRGRLDRKWIAPPKSALLMSVLVDANDSGLAQELWPMVSFCMAHAVQKVTNTFPGLVQPVTLKWPNDVIVLTGNESGSYQKLAGILVEVVGGRLVVGVGVNLVKPDNVDRIFGVSASPIWLNELTRLLVNRDDFANSVLDAFAESLSVLSTGPDKLLDEYRAVLSTLGWMVRVESHGKTWTGRAIDIDSRGRLVVVDDHGTHHVDASEVVHVRPFWDHLVPYLRDRSVLIMKDKAHTGGLVYSTELGRMCPACGQAIAKCSCNKKIQSAPSSDGIVRVSRETKGRGGKGVTLIKGLHLTDSDLNALGKVLKTACGAGGTVKDGVITIQGDHRIVVMELLKVQGYTVKAAGGWFACWVICSLGVR